MQLLTHLVDDVKTRMQSGTVPDCLTVEALHNQHKIGMSDLFLTYSVSPPFGAAIETVSSLRSNQAYGINDLILVDCWDLVYIHP